MLLQYALFFLISSFSENLENSFTLFVNSCIQRVKFI